MNVKKILTALCVAALFTQLGFADVASEFSSEEIQSMQEQTQEIVLVDEEDTTLFMKKEAAEVAIQEQVVEAEEVQN